MTAPAATDEASDAQPAAPAPKPLAEVVLAIDIGGTKMGEIGRAHV